MEVKELSTLFGGIYCLDTKAICRLSSSELVLTVCVPFSKVVSFLHIVRNFKIDLKLYTSSDETKEDYYIANVTINL